MDPKVVPESTSYEGLSQFSSDTFATYAADGSIRFWRLDDGISMGSPVSEEPLTVAAEEASEEVLPSREIVKVLYVDENCVSSIQPPENNGKLILNRRRTTVLETKRATTN